jgi:WD40 repeat protein
MASGDDTLVWDLRTGEHRSMKKLNLRYSRINWSPDGRHVAGKSGVWDVQTGEKGQPLLDERQAIIPQMDRLFGATELTFLTNSRQLAGGINQGTAGSIRIWEVATGRQLRVLAMSDAYTTSLARSADGRWLAGGFASEISRSVTTEWLKVWEFPAGKEARSIGGYLGCVFRVRFSPDGRYLAAAIGEQWGSRPGEVRVYRTGTWEQVWRFTGHSDIVYGLAFSPCGRRLASAAGKTQPEVKIWDLLTGQEVWNLPLPVAKRQRGACYDVDFSPCGCRLVVGTERRILLYDGTPLAESPTYAPLPQ